MKILQKFNIYFYIITLIFILFLSIPVLAYVNTDTSWNLTMPDYDTSLRNTSCGSNGSMYDVVNNIINTTSTDYYTLLVSSPDFENFQVSQIRFFIKWKSSIQYNKLRYYGYNNGNYVTQFKVIYSSNTDRVPYYILKSSTCDNYQNNADYQMFKLLTDTGNYSQAPSGSLGDFNYNNFESPLDTDYILSSLNNNESYNVNKWFYYSTNPYTYTYLSPNSTTYYNKKLCITDNDTCYVENDVLPSYYDLHHNDTPTPTFIGYKTQLDTFYTSLSVSDVSNYNLKIKFNVPSSLNGLSQEPLTYVNNTKFNFLCSGRVDNTNYYSYQNFDCSLSSSYIINNSSVEYTFNNITTNQNLSIFDKIYITIDSSYIYNDINTIIYDLNYTYSLGNFYNTEFKGSIYEKFSNLPLNFKLYVSSNNSINNSYIYYKKPSFINYGVNIRGFQNSTSQQNLFVGQTIVANYNETSNSQGQPWTTTDTGFIKINLTSLSDSGALIWQENSSIPASLELFFNDGFILSFNNNSNSDTFYYIDSNGDIQSGNYVKPDYNDSSDSYDISYYINKVSSFINDLSNDCIEFGNYTQMFYNGLPIVFQTFIFVLFIIACVYFTYLLIKK